MKISVIIPVFNAAVYIEKCIQSVLNQTFTSWELILIDDGSTDNSFEIIRNFAEGDGRIRAFHQENSGAGMARNKGIENAVGDYVVFLDSDDYISENYFSLLSAHDEDVVFIDVDGVSPEGNVVREEHLSKYVDSDKETILRKQMTGCIPWGGVRKAVKRSIINENDIRYTHHKIGEEAIYSFLVLYHAKTIGFINKPVYFYLQRLDSQSHTIMENPWGDVAIRLRDCVKELGVYEEYATTLNAFILAAAAGSTNRIASAYTYKEYSDKIRKRYEQYKSELDQKYGIDNQYLSLKAKVLGCLFRKKMFRLAYILAQLKKYSLNSDGRKNLRTNVSL